MLIYMYFYCYIDIRFFKIILFSTKHLQALSLHHTIDEFKFAIEIDKCTVPKEEQK